MVITPGQATILALGVTLSVILVGIGSYINERKNTENEHGDRLDSIRDDIKDLRKTIVDNDKRLAKGHSRIHREINGDELNECEACNIGLDD